MKRKWMAVGLVAVASLAMGQQVKSQKEAEAVQAMLSAQNPDQKIAAAENVVRNFKDSQFRATAMMIAAQASEQKGDSAGAITYANRAIEIDSKNFESMLIIARQLVRTTREFDLDKDEKVARANKLANDAIKFSASASKPNPQIPDEEWASIQKDVAAEAHSYLGMAASLSKKHDVAINEFKSAIAMSAKPPVQWTIRLGSANIDGGHIDEGVGLMDKALADPDTSAAEKQFATAEKARAEKLKAAK